MLNHPNSKELGLSFLYERAVENKTEKVELVANAISKKVNNLNREEYADGVLSLVLCEDYKRQFEAFFLGLLAVLPKEVYAQMTVSQVAECIRGQPSPALDEFEKADLLARGITFPERGQNSCDQQITRWFVEWLDQPRMTKLAALLGLSFEPGLGNWQLVTCPLEKELARVQGQSLLLHHFESKQQLEAALDTLIA